MRHGVVRIVLLRAPPLTAECATTTASVTTVFLVPAHVNVSVGTPVRPVPTSVPVVSLTPAAIMVPAGPMAHASATPIRPLVTGPQMTALSATRGILVSCAMVHVLKWVASCVQDTESAVWN